MARVPQVTRTIQTTKVVILCMDIEHAEPCNVSVTLPRTYKDKQSMLKAAKKVAETETLKLVEVVQFDVNETLYGMTEQEFIEHARVLPPRNTNNETHD